MRSILCLPVILALAGCAPQAVQTQPATSAPAGAASSAAAAPSDPLAQIATFTVADLQAASADAAAQVPPDVTARLCYDYLAGLIPTIKAPGGQTVGAFVAFQKARDLARGTSAAGGWLTAFNIACAALATDVRLTLAKFGLIAAGTAATGGALAPALPGLGALGATLPIPLP